MDAVYFGDDYKEKFDPGHYLSNYYSKDSKDFILKNGTSLQFLHKLFSKMEGKPHGKLLEFGSGPCIHTILSASIVFQDITLADYAEQNREFLQKWMRNDKDAHDWGTVISYVADLEGKSTSEIEMRTRSAIKEVTVCEVSDDKVQLGTTRGPNDFIITSLCLISACKSVEHYKKSVKGLCSYLAPGGGLILIDVLRKETSYDVGKYNFYNLSMSKEELDNLIEESGLNVQSFEFIPRQTGYGYFYLYATKD